MGRGGAGGSLRSEQDLGAAGVAPAVKEEAGSGDVRGAPAEPAAR